LKEKYFTNYSGAQTGLSTEVDAGGARAFVLGVEAKPCYDGAIMMARTQVTLEPEEHRQARQRAAELGISLAEYLRQLVKRDLGGSRPQANPGLVCGLGSSGGSNIARDKDALLAAAYDGSRPLKRRRARA
jgi:hypothetical protein